MFTNSLRPLCFLAFSLLWAPGVADGQTAVIDRIVAVVGKEPILLSDLNAQSEFYALNNHVDPNTPALKQQVLDAMINEKLILAKALEDTTITVREEEVTSQLDALIAQRIHQVGSEKKLEELYGMPITRMKREFRDETRKQLLIQYLQEAKFGSIQPSRREVEEFYKAFKDSLPTVPEQAEVYHILKIPRAGEAAKASVKAKATRILDSIKAGGDFADFARRYSEDPATASSGGDLGSWRRGQFVKDFEEAVFSLKENQISDIVETTACAAYSLQDRSGQRRGGGGDCISQELERQHHSRRRFFGACEAILRGQGVGTARRCPRLPADHSIRQVSSRPPSKHAGRRSE
ncbi:MAG: hypothetical protein E6K56_02150 [Ignavibacteria bacterium]|nr:MAG: hypothetical protein E6K56_02150 [Ignavibacteria bacterium]